MLKAPKVPWPYRLAALLLALGLGCYSVEFYVLGRKFAGAVTNYTKLAAEQAAKAEQAALAAAPKPPPSFKDHAPDVVPVMIIKSPPDKKN